MLTLTELIIYFCIIYGIVIVSGLIMRKTGIAKKLPQNLGWKILKVTEIVFMGIIIFSFLTIIALFLCVIISGPP